MRSLLLREVVATHDVAPALRRSVLGRFLQGVEVLDSRHGLIRVDLHDWDRNEPGHPDGNDIRRQVAAAIYLELEFIEWLEEVE